jgi:antitoxin ParD1/3/4
METVNIMLPEPLKDFVDGEVGSGRYGSASEYIRELIREDEKRKAQEKLEALLLEGVESGAAPVMTDEAWTELRSAARQEYETRRQVNLA